VQNQGFDGVALARDDRRMRRLALTFLTFCSCAGAGLPEVVDVREVSGSLGAPSIDRIRDAGNVRVPIAGPWSGASDGVASPGELIVIEGDNFGRLPTVSIGGRATTVVARTAGGGIVARVPTGVPAGAVPISVAHPKGRATRTFPVRRLAVVIHDGKLSTFAVEKDGLRAVGAPLAVPGASGLRLSSDGGAAYVIAGDKLYAVDLGAPGGPRVSAERQLSHKARLVATAMDAPLAAVVGDGKLTLFSTKLSSAPQPWDTIELPKEAHTARALELSPDGKLLATLHAESNTLVAVTLSENPLSARFLTAVDVLPGERLPLVRDLAFSSDGETLWIVSGDNAQSLPAVQPTRLSAVRLLPHPEDVTAPGEQLLSVWRTQSVPGATAPLRIAVARGQPLASGTTIRMPPEKAAVFVSSVADNLFKLADVTIGARGAYATVEKLWHPPKPGMLVRADISGGGGPLFAVPQILSSIDLTPDAQLIVATAARVAPAPATNSLVLEFGLTVAPLWGEITPLFLALGPLDPAELKPPFDFGEVRIQP
jgi:hypothetical protein